MLWKRSCPAVSQICNRIVLLSRDRVIISKSTPMVLINFGSQSLEANRLSKHDFPTPLSPTNTIFNKKSYSSPEALRAIQLASFCYWLMLCKCWCLKQKHVYKNSVIIQKQKYFYEFTLWMVHCVVVLSASCLYNLFIGQTSYNESMWPKRVCVPLDSKLLVSAL